MISDFCYFAFEIAGEAKGETFVLVSFFAIRSVCYPFWITRFFSEQVINTITPLLLKPLCLQ